MRVKGIFQPSDDPVAADGLPSAAVREMFEYLAPGDESPKIARDHVGLAITALNPQLAVHLARLSRFMALELEWCARADFRELAIAAVNLHFNSARSFEARLGAAQAAGIGPEKLAALPYWRTTELLDEDERLIVEYANSAMAGSVSDQLFARAVARFGEKGTVEFTSVIGFWSCWAMIINAACP